jgi:hypothetical protein
MKACLLSLMVLGACAVAVGQGTLNFCNINPAGLNAPVYGADGKTKVSGANCTAELLAGPSSNALASVATTPVLTGKAAGYYQGGVVGVVNVAPGAVAFVQVRVWNGAGCFDCPPPSIWAQTPVFEVTTGGSCCPPTLPAPLLGLTPIVLGVDANPRVKLSPSSTNTIIVSWGQLYPLYTVQQSPSLNPPNWTTLTNTPGMMGQQYVVEIPKPETTMFYRLISRY